MHVGVMARLGEGQRHKKHGGVKFRWTIRCFLRHLLVRILSVMLGRNLLLLAALASAGFRPSTAAQVRANDGHPGRHIYVAVVTFGPGAVYWERFGHNAIWIRDSLNGIDELYDYGRFSFNQENFLSRFLQKRMLYWMQGDPASRVIPYYQNRNRSIYVQALNLTPDQRVELRDFLIWNDTDENRFYAYDYYLDNCSTRVRDAVDRVLGGRIHAATSQRTTGTTFRFHTLRLMAGRVLLYTGLHALLGNPVDRPITAWDEMFLPMKVREYLRTVTVVDQEGREVPLVSAEETLFESTNPPPRPAPPRWTWAFLLVGTAAAVGIAALGYRGSTGRIARGAFVTVGTTWLLVAGLCGVIITALWGFTAHTVAAWNENLFFLNPIALVMAIVLGPSVLGKRWATHLALWTGLAIGGLSVAGAVLQVLPWLDQVNGPIVALTVPINLAVAAVAWWLTSSAASRQPPAERPLA